MYKDCFFPSSTMQNVQYLSAKEPITIQYISKYVHLRILQEGEGGNNFQVLLGPRNSSAEKVHGVKYPMETL